MEEMTRLKTITSRKKIFLSPFVFTEEEAKKRIKSASETFEKGTGTKTELVKVSNYPRSAVWSIKKHGKEVMSTKRLIECIEMLTLKWEVMESANN